MDKAASRLLNLVPSFRPPSPAERFARAESFVAATGARIVPGDRARYDLLRDVIEIPPLQRFDDPAVYYGILAHELVHWTRHPSRLDRDFGCRAAGDHGYAMEELVAGLGAFFLAADLRLAALPAAKAWAYIEVSLHALGDDGEAFRISTRHAEEAVAFLQDTAHGLGWC